MDDLVKTLHIEAKGKIRYQADGLAKRAVSA